MGDDIVQLTGDLEPLVTRAPELLFRAECARSALRSRRMRTISVPVASTSNHAASAQRRGPARRGLAAEPGLRSHTKAKYPTTIETHATARWPAFTTVTNATMNEKKIGPRP